MLGVRLGIGLHARIADRAERWRVAAHAAVDHRAVDALAPRAPALEEPGVVAVAPPGGLGADRPAGAVRRARRGDAGRDGRRAIDELSPLERRAVRVDGEVRCARFSTRVGTRPRAVLVGEPAGPVPELVRHHGRARPEGDDLEPAASAPAEAWLVEDHDHEVVVRYPRVEGVLDLHPGARPALEPAVCPGPAVDVTERRVPDRRRDDRVVGRVGRRPVLVVDPLADARLRRDQVDAEDVVRRLVLIEVVHPEHPVEKQRLDVVVVCRLVRVREAVAEHGDVELRPRRPGFQDLRNAVRHRPRSLGRELGSARSDGWGTVVPLAGGPSSGSSAGRPAARRSSGPKRGRSNVRVARMRLVPPLLTFCFYSSRHSESTTGRRGRLLWWRFAVTWPPQVLAQMLTREAQTVRRHQILGARCGLARRQWTAATRAVPSSAQPARSWMRPSTDAESRRLRPRARTTSTSWGPIATDVFSARATAQ